MIGFIGNRLYINFARKCVGELVTGSVPGTTYDTDLIAGIRKQGGVSWVGPLVLLLAFVFLIICTYFLTQQTTTVD